MRECENYESCLVYELEKLELSVQKQVVLPVVYKELQLPKAYRIDLLVNDQVVVELKAVDKILPGHEAQVLSYLKLS